MTIIFYEKEYCEEVLKNGVDRLHRRDLNYLAKYWGDVGYSELEIENNLINFCKKNDPNFNDIQNYAFYHKAVLHSRNNKLRFPTPIKVTKCEIESIQSVSDYKLQKFLFIMIVVAKFFKYHQSRKKISPSKYDQGLYSNTPIRELKNLAGVSFTRDNWKEIKHNLTTNGLITPTIVGSSKWAIGFWNELSETEILITDYRNPIIYYQEYCGENIIHCTECGVKILKKSKNHLLCKNCWKEKRLKTFRESSEKYYKKFFSQHSQF